MIRCFDSSGVGQACFLQYLASTQMQSEDTYLTRATQTGLRNAAEPFFPPLKQAQFVSEPSPLLQIRRSSLVNFW